MGLEIEYMLRVQQLGAYSLAFYQQFINAKYVEPIDLFPLIPAIKEIPPKQRTEEDKEKWRQELLMRTIDNSKFFRKLNPIKKNLSKTKDISNLINTLI